MHLPPSSHAPGRLAGQPRTRSLCTLLFALGTLTACTGGGDSPSGDHDAALGDGDITSDDAGAPDIGEQLPCEPAGLYAIEDVAILDGACDLLPPAGDLTIRPTALALLLRFDDTDWSALMPAEDGRCEFEARLASDFSIFNGVQRQRSIALTLDGDTLRGELTDTLDGESDLGERCGVRYAFTGTRIGDAPPGRPLGDDCGLGGCNAGAVCAVGGEVACDSAICLWDPDSPGPPYICTQPCDEARPCPDGFMCLQPDLYFDLPEDGGYCAVYRPICGNGVVDDDEYCDDGNLLPDDRCSPDCRSDYSCGDGVLNDGEACDPQATTDPVPCTDECRLDLPPGMHRLAALHPADRESRRGTFVGLQVAALSEGRVAVAWMYDDHACQNASNRSDALYLAASRDGGTSFEVHRVEFTEAYLNRFWLMTQGDRFHLIARGSGGDVQLVSDGAGGWNGPEPLEGLDSLDDLQRAGVGAMGFWALGQKRDDPTIWLSHSADGRRWLEPFAIPDTAFDRRDGVMRYGPVPGGWLAQWNADGRLLSAFSADGHAFEPAAAVAPDAGRWIFGEGGFDVGFDAELGALACGYAQNPRGVLCARYVPGEDRWEVLGSMATASLGDVRIVRSPGESDWLVISDDSVVTAQSVDVAEPFEAWARAELDPRYAPRALVLPGGRGEVSAAYLLRDDEASEVGIMRSSDGGLSWHDVVPAGPPLPVAFDPGGEVRLAIDPEGREYVAWLQRTAGHHFDVYVRRAAP